MAWDVYLRLDTFVCVWQLKKRKQKKALLDVTDNAELVWRCIILTLNVDFFAPVARFVMTQRTQMTER